MNPIIRRATPAVVLLLAAGVHAEWNPAPNWKDSYAVGGRCYCDSSNFDHALDTKSADTPAGRLNVVRICEDIESALGSGPAEGRIPYNDIQCGNGPANDAPDEAGCPGRVDIGAAGCDVVGPTWDLQAVYGDGEPGSGESATPLERSGWVMYASGGNATVGNATDGEASSRWSTGQSQRGGQWFEIDLQERETFDTIVLETQASPLDYPRGFDVAVSDDGENWTPVASGEGDGAVTTIALDERSARYLRIEQTGGDDFYWWSIHDLNLYRPSSRRDRS